MEICAKSKYICLFSCLSLSQSTSKENSAHFVSARPSAPDGRIVLRLTKAQPKKNTPGALEPPTDVHPPTPPPVPSSSQPTDVGPPTPLPVSPVARASVPSSPPPPPSKRGRSPSPRLPVAPQHSSTLRSEYDLAHKSPIVLRIHTQAGVSKPAKKKARLSSTLGTICAYCAEPVRRSDLRLKNNLVSCAGHLVHKYCQQLCLDAHSDDF